MRFSVLTPVYNGAPTLEAAAATLVAQTFRDWEWVIVDDGSTDGTAEIADALSSRDDRIRVIHQPNGGVSVARNRAMDESRGDYIVWLDADDAFTPDALEYVSSLVTAMPDVEALYFPYMVRGSDPRLSDRAAPRSSPLTPVPGPVAFDRLYVDPATRGQHWQPWRFAYRRGFFPKFRPGVIHEDVDVLPVHLRSLGRVFLSDRPFYIYTPDREGAATQFFTPRRVRDILGVTDRNWGCEPLRTMLTWNLWGYFRAAERFPEPERGELMSRFREHPEYLGLTPGEVRRNPGLDVARVVAIFLVVLQHVLFLGGLSNDGMGTFHKLQARFLEAASQCCIDVFGLLTGFLLADRNLSGIFDPRRWRRFARLWLQVFMTGSAVLAGCWAISCFGGGPRPSSGDWLRAVLPLTYDEYWYFTGYFCVFLLSPLLVPFARRSWSPWLALALFAVIGGVVAFPGGDGALPLKGGYSSAWLVILAFWGMVLGGGGIGSRLAKVSPRGWFAVSLALVGLTAAQRFLMASVPPLKEFFADEWTLHHYTSPTVVLASAAFLLGCSRLDFGHRARKLVFFFAPCAFGIYLLHVQPFFFAQFFKGRFSFLDSLPDALFGLAAVAVAGAVFLVCLLIERLRRKSIPGRWS